MAIKRLFVEKKTEQAAAALKLKGDLQNVLGLACDDVKIILRYDVDGLSDDDFARAVASVFSEPPVDNVYYENLPKLDGYAVIATEYLPGQYDQRADSCAQCVQLLTLKQRPQVKCATIYAIKGVTDCDKIANYLINPVEARRASLAKPTSLESKYDAPEKAQILDGFIEYSPEEIFAYHKLMGFAMSVNDLTFVQEYFASEKRDPTVTELKVIDTYWSDHCRHTTFLTNLENIKINSDIPQVQETLDKYFSLFDKFYAGRTDKYHSLMDMALMGARELKAQGKLDNLDASDEINACSIKVKAKVDGKMEDWLVMFKNETHNHPTEIEPFGGAATCLGGAIRDPLSGRVYVYQAMRVTGAGDITASLDKTLKGKLPQRVISKTAAAGFSAYGNQIGLATGGVHEIYHDGFVAKRLETGFVVGAAPAENVVRSVPMAGDVVLLIGGETGRDGCGGATGSSKAHTLESIDLCGAEVQKGNPLTERKIQRLFRDKNVTSIIKRCNDFGAGGVSVAIGELSDGLDIDLDVVPKKYQGLSATELCISESQERMAVVVESKNAQKMIDLCAEENLTATIVATVTDRERMRMFFNKEIIVDLSRKFLDSNGVRQRADCIINEYSPKFFSTLREDVAKAVADGDFSQALKLTLADKNVCSQKGLGEIFDSTIGAGTVLMPFGGDRELTPSIAMAALLPVTNGVTSTATVAAYGYNADLMSESQFVGAIYSTLMSVIKVVITGAPIESVRLTFQEFFERLNTDPKRWGKPCSALLGALYAQLNLGLAAIGGKDSMSGTFEKYDVPPTLISFALGIADAENIISNTLSRVGQKVYRLSLKRDENNVPDLEYAGKLLRLIQTKIVDKTIDFATVVDNGGVAAAVVKSAIGNDLGFNFTAKIDDLFTPNLGDILVSASNLDAFKNYQIVEVGTAIKAAKFALGGNIVGGKLEVDIIPDQKLLALEDAVRAFSGTFEKVYPTSSRSSGVASVVSYSEGKTISAKKKIVKPQVFIPVFPGTNCEYDTAKRFMLAGANPVIYVVKNRNAAELARSIDDMARLIKNSQILAFPGGFSGGDEPDGSGKFIAAAFRNSKIEDEVMDLLYKRDGLALGICNGFQALIKLGLLPNGEIDDLDATSPTLTFNNISRHVSTVVRIRVASNLSPWLAGVKVGQEFAVAVSHGEGKFIASQSDMASLIKCGQIATQYVNDEGLPTMVSPFNPNGSYNAVEGITSDDGRIFGKMGHSERIGKNIMKNIPAETDMKIFESGVKYFQ